MKATSMKGTRICLVVVVLVVSTWLYSPTAEADVMCKWFGHCVYEAPAFSIAVVDKETGKPLADVHALAEWVQYASHGTNGPIMVLEAISGPDGILKFTAWGPIRGSSAGLSLNQDPVISLFKPGYGVLIINNHPGTDERARVRGFAQHGGTTFALELFRGSPDDWVAQLEKVWSGLSPRIADDQRLEFRAQYLNRVERVSAERNKLPARFQSQGQFFWFVDGLRKFLVEGHR